MKLGMNKVYSIISLQDEIHQISEDDYYLLECIANRYR